MGATSLSVGPPALAEIKKVIRSVTYEDAAAGVAEALKASSPEEVLQVLTARLGRVLDLNKFSASLGLSRPE